MRIPPAVPLALSFAGCLAGLVTATPAAAEVNQVGDRGFVVRLTAQVPAGADAVWRELIRPEDWWDAEHSFSGNAANLSLDPRPGGCFCEVLPALPQGDAKAALKGAAPRGGVEHMRVIYVERPRALRMLGSLGPLQSEALTGTFTVQLKPMGEGTAILWEYVVGGFMRPQPQAIATAVDAVLAGQLARLAGKLGAASAPPPQAASPAPEAKVGADFLDEKPPADTASPAPEAPPQTPAEPATSAASASDDGKQVIVGR